MIISKYNVLCVFKCFAINKVYVSDTVCCIAGWEGDSVGRFHGDQGADDSHAEHLGDGLRLRAVRQHDRRRVSVRECPQRYLMPQWRSGNRYDCYCTVQIIV